MLKSVLHEVWQETTQLAVIDARIEEAAAQLTERQLSRLPSIGIVRANGGSAFQRYI